MRKVILSVVIVMALVATSCKSEAKKEKEPVKTEVKKEMATKEVYQCPMDCEKGKTYKEAGSCPVCKMDLKKVEKQTEDHSEHKH